MALQHDRRARGTSAAGKIEALNSFEPFPSRSSSKRGSNCDSISLIILRHLKGRRLNVRKPSGL